MTDPRFTTAFATVDGLLSGLDVDEVGDIETLLMFLFDMPVGVSELLDGEEPATSLEVALFDGSLEIAFVLDLPKSMIEIARLAARSAADLASMNIDEVTGEEPADALAMDGEELITALQQALGKVRIFNLTFTDG